MSTTIEFIDYIAEQVDLGAAFTHKRMFGEYGLYLHDKVIAFACDNSLFIKAAPATEALTAALRKAAKVKPGDKVELEIHPAEQEPEPEVPDDLRKALADAPDARAVWDDITAVARRDWIHWITSPKKPETRVRRVEVTCDKLASGQRRACCFDRSGMYSKAFAAPEAAD